MTTINDDFLASRTPVEIDTAIAALWQERYAHQDAADRAWHYMVSQLRSVLGMTYRQEPNAQQIREWLAEYSEISESEEMQAEAYPQVWTRKDATKVWEHYLTYQDHAAKADEVLTEIEPFHDEYVRRGRWNRAYLVDNTNGHVHSSMHCSSCYPTTRYHWLVDFSDKSETEIVEAAGERACTVCYPSAPVEVLSRPTQMFTPDEIEKQKARDERQAKRAAAQAAAVVVEGYRGWSSRPSTHTFKTERAARLALASAVYDAGTGRGNLEMREGYLSDMRAIVAALEAKGLEVDMEEVVAKAKKKATKDYSGWKGLE